MEALYFPSMSLPPATWVNPALLYFDRIGVIAPHGVDIQSYDPRTRELLAEDLVRPVWSHDLWRLGEATDEAFVASLLRSASRRDANYEVRRIHAGKVAYGDVSRVLCERGLLSRTYGEWLEGPAWLVDSLMTYIAAQISLSSPTPLPLISNDDSASRILMGRELPAVGRRLEAVTRLLRVPPTAEPSELRAFRDTHREELRRFRLFVTELVARRDEPENGYDLDTRLAEAERVRDHLEGELSAVSWSGDAPTIALTAIAFGAAAAETALWSAGAGLLALLYGLGDVAGRYRVRHDAGREPLAYATQVARNWPPRGRNIR